MRGIPSFYSELNQMIIVDLSARIQMMEMIFVARAIFTAVRSSRERKCWPDLDMNTFLSLYSV